MKRIDHWTIQNSVEAKLYLFIKHQNKKGLLELLKWGSKAKHRKVAVISKHFENFII